MEVGELLLENRDTPDQLVDVFADEFFGISLDVTMMIWHWIK